MEFIPQRFLMPAITNPTIKGFLKSFLNRLLNVTEFVPLSQSILTF
jgi:hypothetical protein